MTAVSRLRPAGNEFAMRSLPTPLGAIARGPAARVIGTAAMTLHQKAISRIQSSRSCDRLCGDGDAPQDPWKEAPTPALVGKRVIEGVFHRRVPADRIGALTTFMHWAYGIAWGGVYGTVQGTVRANPALLGPSFGAAVWAASYAELVPMGLYDPPWNYPPKTLANDLGYHATYGAGVAAGYLLFEHI